jgi:hypothetical protein
MTIATMDSQKISIPDSVIVVGLQKAQLIDWSDPLPTDASVIPSHIKPEKIARIPRLLGPANPTTKSSREKPQNKPRTTMSVAISLYLEVEFQDQLSPFGPALPYQDLPFPRQKAADLVSQSCRDRERFLPVG